MTKPESIRGMAHDQWREWVNEQHGEHNPNGIRTDQQKLFVNMWYANPPETDEILNPKQDETIKKTMVWKYIVQSAFLDGYEAGFTDRIFRGNNDANI